MDTVEGAAVIFRKILGKIVAINGLVPGWVIEGQATMQETWQTAGGRGRSNIVHMIKRTTVLTDTFHHWEIWMDFKHSGPLEICGTSLVKIL